MSASYDMYTEVKVDGKWVCINPALRMKPYYEDDSRVAMTYWSGSRSSFSNTASKIVDTGYIVHVDSVSDVLMPMFDVGYFRKSAITLQQMKDSLPSGCEYQYHGYVDKNDLFSYLADDGDIWEYLTIDQYKRLPKEEKKAYAYYEWDDFDDWVHHFKAIIKNIEALVYMWCHANYCSVDDADVRLILFEG